MSTIYGIYINNYFFFYFIDQLIDLKILTHMRVEHVHKLLEKFPLGIIILFESELIKWQNSISMNDNIIQSNIFNEKKIHAQVCVNKTSHYQKTFDLQLDKVLQSSGKGSLILDYYKNHNKLNDGIRTTLVDIILIYKSYGYKTNTNVN